MPILIPIAALLLFTAAVFLPEPPPHLIHNGEGWLYTFWTKSTSWPLVWQLLLTWIILLGTVWKLTYIDHHFEIRDNRSFTVAWLFLFLVLSPGILERFHPVYLATLMLLFSFRFALALYRSHQPPFTVFNLAVAYSISILIYPPFVLFLPVMIFSYFLMKTRGPGYLSVFIIGILAPLTLCGVTLLLLGEARYLLEDLLKWFEIRSTWPPLALDQPPYFWVWLTVIGIWVIWGSLRFRSQKNLSRQFHLFLFFFFLSGILIFSGLERVGSEFLWVLLVPVVFLLANWIDSARSGWFRDLFFLVLMGFWIFQQLIRLFPGLI